MKALGYIRVSTSLQVEGVSLSNQRERIEAYCQYKSFDLVAVIEDAGVSGGINKAREGFIALLDRIKQEDVDSIILYSLERLSRDMLTLLALERYLNEHGVELHTVDGQVDTSTPDGFMNFAMKSFLGEMERRQIKYRTKKAMGHKKAHGEVVGSVPYGQQRDGKALVVDLNEQGTVRAANAMYGEGARLVDIVKSLNDQGKRTRTGKPWTATQVKRLLTNYEGSFRKSTNIVSVATRNFIEAIG